MAIKHLLNLVQSKQIIMKIEIKKEDGSYQLTVKRSPKTSYKKVKHTITIFWPYGAPYKSEEDTHKHSIYIVCLHVLSSS